MKEILLENLQGKSYANPLVIYFRFTIIYKMLEKKYPFCMALTEVMCRAKCYHTVLLSFSFILENAMMRARLNHPKKRLMIHKNQAAKKFKFPITIPIQKKWHILKEQQKLTLNPSKKKENPLPIETVRNDTD